MRGRGAEGQRGRGQGAEGQRGRGAEGQGSREEGAGTRCCSFPAIEGSRTNKFIYFEMHHTRNNASKIKRLNLFMVFSPLHPAPCPFYSSLTLD